MYLYYVSTYPTTFFVKVPSSRLHEAAQYFHPRPADLPTALSNALVFTFVRHPFERLVSAYRDKLELAKMHGYVYTRYAYKIIKHASGQDKLAASLAMRQRRRPTFAEFVAYLVDGWAPDYNDHWLPYWLHCHLCHVEYDVVGKMETVQEDFKFINGKLCFLYA